MKKLFITLVTLFSLSVTIISEAQAQANTNSINPTSSETDPMIAYRAYNVSIEAGDIATAANEAQKAWRAAEVKWGASNANTAALAYNAAWANELAGKPDIALEPARRAVELAPNAKNSYKLEDAEFLRANAEYNLASPEQKLRLTGQFASIAKKVASDWNDTLIISALNSISSNYLELERPGNAKDIANLALLQIRRLNLETQFIEAITMFNRGRANMFLRNYKESVSDIIDARILYGASETEDDLAWGKLAAWHYAAKALAVSNSLREQDSAPKPESKLVLASNEFRGMTSEEFRITMPKETECKTGDFLRDTQFGTNISFPDDQQRNGIVAGVLIKFDLSENGAVENARIIGAVPSEGFGASSLSAVSKWRYNLSPNISAQCRKGVLVPIIFAYR